MTPILAELVDLLALERLEEDLFRGRSQDLGWGTVYGGQVLGQALSAASQTVPAERVVHSLHSYFLRPGAVDRPIVYEVDRIRDGRSFTTRRVVAIQKGRAIFNLSASFQIQEPGFEHRDPMPEVPGPEGLLPEHELARRVADRIPERLRAQALAERPIEVRANGDLPDDPALHRYLLAYASDSHFIGTAMQPHAVSWVVPGLQVASLDHAMWFHRPFRIDDWLLHVIESPSASGARGLVRGRWYTRDGRLVVSDVQEGLMRDRRGQAGATTRRPGP